MQCYIYRSSVKDGLYVYLAEEDGLEKLPAPVMKQLGIPEYAMSLELSADRKLGQEDATTVMENLTRQGFHVQMPREIEKQLESIALSATLNVQAKT
ncbi:MAG: YcgL domain-containing protein [Granulosicoccus sp.]